MVLGYNRRRANPVRWWRVAGKYWFYFSDGNDGSDA